MDRYIEFLEIYLARLREYSKNPIENGAYIEITLHCIEVVVEAIKCESS